VIDKDLGDDMLKLVRYKILFVKREYEVAFQEMEDLVVDNLNSAAFTAWKIAEFLDNLARGETDVPKKWEEKNYPADGVDPNSKNVLVRYRKDGKLIDLNHDDKKYLRLYYEVVERYPRESFKYEEQQIRVLEEIRDRIFPGAGYGNRHKSRQVIRNSISMELVVIPAGEFLMGSPATDKDASPDEQPQHLVQITKPFLMSKYEVTVGQFLKFVQETGYKTEGQKTGKGSTGLDLRTGKVEQKPEYTWQFWLHEDEHQQSGFEQTEEHPVVCVSWNDAREFCNWLSNKEGKAYRLPTEAEWEYACRARTTTRYYSGDSEDRLKDVANLADASLKARWVWRSTDPPFPEGTHLPPYAKAWNDGYPFTAPVGRFKPNRFGLYDMHGNVGEWCSDWYDPNYYAAEIEIRGKSVSKDPTGPATGVLVDISDRLPGAPPRTLRVIRGGVWLDPATGLRSADRRTHRRHPVDSAADIGFRVVRSYQVSVSTGAEGRPQADMNQDGTNNLEK